MGRPPGSSKPRFLKGRILPEAAWLETDAEVKDLIFLAWWATDSERQLEGDRL